MVIGQEKGYYSIGNNAEKLKLHSNDKAGDSFVRVEKGYYSIESNRKKLKTSTGKDTSNKKRFPVINKGYYSIGNNSARLEGNRE